MSLVTKDYLPPPTFWPAYNFCFCLAAPLFNLKYLLDSADSASYIVFTQNHVNVVTRFGTPYDYLMILTQSRSPRATEMFVLSHLP